MKFIGRDRERQLLQRWQTRLPDAQLSVIYGRRRVGKTRLVLEAFKESKILRFEGLEGQATTAQQRHFLTQLASMTGRPELDAVKVSNWSDILGYLVNYLESETRDDGAPIIVFFDEFQWMCAERADLVSRLKFVWDRSLKELPLHLILCGSVSSFLVKKVIHSKALFGRIHLEIDLQPLEIQEVTGLLPKRSLKEVIELYMVLGGIPQYLEMIDPRRSTMLNIQDLCFSAHGYLVKEYERLLVSHFGKVPHFQTVLETLGKRAIASRDELAKACDLSSGGSLSQYLDELDLAGFVERYVPLGRPADSKVIRYRLSDAYLLFYFRFIRPALRQIRHPQALPVSRFLPEKKLAPWRGLAFERVCRMHAHRIAERLGFGAVSYEAGSWFQRADSSPGAQIDLMFVRADKVVTLCEVKYRDEKIGMSVITEVEAKIATYPNPKKMSVEPVLITASEPTRELAESEFFTRILTLEDLFGR